MKVLFAVGNDEIPTMIIKKYQEMYKEIISCKRVYYFNAILKEIQKDKTYDRIVVSEDLEAFSHTQYDQIDQFIFDKLDGISDEASNSKGEDIPIILLCAERRTKSEQILVKLFTIGVYNALIGPDRSVDEVCNLINKPRTKKEAKLYYKIDSGESEYKSESENDVSEIEIQNILAHYKRLGKDEERYIESFDNIAAQYNDNQLRIISKFLPLNVKAVLEERSNRYQQIMSFNNAVSESLRRSRKEQENDGPTAKLLQSKIKNKPMSGPVVIPSAVNMSANRNLNREKRMVDFKVPQNNQRNIEYQGEPLNRQINTPSGLNQNVQTNTFDSKNMYQQPPVEGNNQYQRIPNKPIIHEPSVSQPLYQDYQGRSINDQLHNQQQSNNNVINETKVPIKSEVLKNQTIQDNSNLNFNVPTNNEYNQLQRNESLSHDEGRKEDDINKGLATTQNVVAVKKRGRGRPRKNPLPEEAPNNVVLPESKNMNSTNTVESQQNNQASVLPGFDNANNTNAIEPQQNNQSSVLPGFDNTNNMNQIEPQQNNQSSVLPGFDNTNNMNQIEPQQNNQSSVLPGFDNTNNMNQIEPQQNNQSSALPGFDNANNTNAIEPQQNNQSATLPGFDNNNSQVNNQQLGYNENLNNNNTNEQTGYNNGYSGNSLNNTYQNSNGYQQNENNLFDDNNGQQNDYKNENNINDNLSYDNVGQNNNKDKFSSKTDNEYIDNLYTTNDYSENQYGNNPYNIKETKNETQEDIYSGYYNNQEKKKAEYVNTIDISNLLTPDKKIATFLGTSKNGTSFIVNNIATLMSSMGIRTAILDTTSNRNSYYIYTKNEETLRNTAAATLDNLISGQAQGINVNKFLTVFTSLPDGTDKINQVDEVLETLVKNYSLVLIDADFNTSIGYFKQTQELYLVQSLDILTIQPLTAFLRELKAKNVLDENKVRIILNKAVRVKGVSEKTIIGGMAFYNDPAMSFMTQLFDRNMVKYITIPFEDETYVKYLENIINCEISLKGYSKIFMQSLRELANMIYPLMTSGGQNNKNPYRPPSAGYNEYNSNNRRI